MWLIYAYQEESARVDWDGTVVILKPSGWFMIARIIPAPGVPADKNPTVVSLRVKFPRLKVVDSPRCKAPPFILEQDLVKPGRRTDDESRGPPEVYFIE